MAPKAIASCFLLGSSLNLPLSFPKVFTFTQDGLVFFICIKWLQNSDMSWGSAGLESCWHIPGVNTKTFQYISNSCRQNCYASALRAPSTDPGEFIWAGCEFSWYTEWDTSTSSGVLMGVQGNRSNKVFFHWVSSICSVRHCVCLWPHTKFSTEFYFHVPKGN